MVQSYRNPIKQGDMMDHFPKLIVTLDEAPMGEGGIKQIHAVDFLPGEAANIN